MIMAVYLTVSLSISAFMNWYNQRIALKGAEVMAAPLPGNAGTDLLARRGADRAARAPPAPHRPACRPSCRLGAEEPVLEIPNTLLTLLCAWLLVAGGAAADRLGVRRRRLAGGRSGAVPRGGWRLLGVDRREAPVHLVRPLSPSTSSGGRCWRACCSSSSLLVSCYPAFLAAVAARPCGRSSCRMRRADVGRRARPDLRLERPVGRPAADADPLGGGHGLLVSARHPAGARPALDMPASARSASASSSSSAACRWSACCSWPR